MEQPSKMYGYTQALIALVQACVPAVWGVNSTDQDETNAGKIIVDEAFGGCTDTFYQCIKVACRGDIEAARKFYEMVTEDLKDAGPFTLKLEGSTTVHASINYKKANLCASHNIMAVAWVMATLRLWMQEKC